MKTSNLVALSILACGAIGLNGNVQAGDTLTNYLADISANPVSAGELVGLGGSAIRNIQSAKDITVALSPLSGDSGQGGFGLAITPARTGIEFLATPIETYVKKENWWARLLGSTSLSYAQNNSTISGVSYRRYSYSLDTTYYWNFGDDPIVIGHSEFQQCPKSIEVDILLMQALTKILNTTTFSPEEKNRLLVETNARFEERSAAEWSMCLKNALSKQKWNVTKVSFSVGAGWIKPDATAGSTQSLGRALVAAITYKTGDDNALNLTVRRTTNEIDLKTISTTPTFTSKTLAALRFTQGVASDSTLRLLAEISNASTNNSATTVSNSVFKYAVGFDKKLATGVWAEFRIGRNRTADGLAEQTTSLLTLNWSPVSTLPVEHKMK